MGVFRSRQGGRRLAVVDGFSFPAGLRQRCAHRHGELTGDGLRLVEDGLRQWFRLGARHPKARLTMPSVIVGDLWQEFALHGREYAEFCTAALGHPLPVESVIADRGRLRATFQAALEDEAGGSGSLPLIFRVDRELAVSGGRFYLADCGGRGVCHELKGSICLQHLDGPGKPPGGGGKWPLKSGEHDGGGMAVAGCGCGGGG